MRLLDKWLQDWRISKIKRWIPAGAKLLDIGCHQGELFEKLQGHIGPSVGIDSLTQSRHLGPHQIIHYTFAGQLPFASATFDVVTLLAVIEHIQEIKQLIEECKRVLVPTGRVVLTVPAPAADHLLDWLIRLRLADGMSLEEHHGFDPTQLPEFFEKQGFRLEQWERFQLGFNNLMVFRAEQLKYFRLGLDNLLIFPAE